MYALWPRPDEPSAGWAERLRGEVAEQLTAAGARGVQVNVSDDAVATAMLRITTFDVPISAVVSVWVDTVAGPVRPALEQLLAEVSGRIAGYLVTESVPMAPQWEPGARGYGFTNVAFLRRPAELDPATWLDRWQNHHTTVAIETQETHGYVQNVVVRALTPDAPVVDGIVEEVFRPEALQDVHAFYGSGGDDAELARRLQAMAASVDTFGAAQGIDVVPTSRYVLTSPTPCPTLS